MGFYLRKSFKVGPVRFNLSKSGIGTSVGVKGFRIGQRPNGSRYMHGGRYGFYYRKELGRNSKMVYDGNGIPYKYEEVNDSESQKREQESIEIKRIDEQEKARNNKIILLGFFGLSGIIIGIIGFTHKSLFLNVFGVIVTILTFIGFFKLMRGKQSEKVGFQKVDQLMNGDRIQFEAGTVRKSRPTDYQILGLKTDASMEEIKQSYKDLVNVWHPDRFYDNPRLEKKAQEKLKEINDAYERLEFSLSKDSSQGSEQEDKSGEYVIVKEEGKLGKYGYADKNGNIVINPEFSLATEFSEGLAAVMLFVSDLDTKWGYIDKTGKMVITPQFDFAAQFSEGLAPVKIGSKFGYIDKTGRIVIHPQFDMALPFSKGVATVNIGDKWFHINKTY